MDVTQTMRVRDEFRQRLDDHPLWYDYYKTRFLMLDLFPENARRFQMSFEQCVGAA